MTIDAPLPQALLDEPGFMSYVQQYKDRVAGLLDQKHIDQLANETQHTIHITRSDTDLMQHEEVSDFLMDDDTPYSDRLLIYTLLLGYEFQENTAIHRLTFAEEGNMTQLRAWTGNYFSQNSKAGTFEIDNKIQPDPLQYTSNNGYQTNKIILELLLESGIVNQQTKTEKHSQNGYVGDEYTIR